MTPILLSKMAVNDANKRAIEYKVSQMRTVGNTNLPAGLLMCFKLFEQPATDSDSEGSRTRYSDRRSYERQERAMILR
jgi:hypothetical protein